MPDSGRRVRHDRTVLLLAAVAAAPAVVAMVASLTSSWRPVGDQALEVLRIADVGGRHTPLVGAWSRWGWSHPGPWLFWLLAPFHALGGPVGVLVGTALVAGVSAAAAVVVAARRGGGHVVAALVALAAVVLCAAAGPDGLVDPWNPYVAMLPFLLVLVAAAGAADGDAASAVVALVAGSWCVQAHAVYLLPVAAVLVPALGVTARGLRDAASGARRRLLGVAGALMAVLWVPPLVEQVAGTGNLGRILRFSLAGSEPVVGWSRALRVANDQLSPTGPWIGGNEAGPVGLASTSRWPWAPLVVVALAGLVVLRRRAHRPVGRPLVALVAVVAAFLTTGRLTGAAWPYLMRFWWPVAALVAVVLAEEVLDRLSAVRPVTVVRAVGAAAGAVALVGVVVGLPVRPPVAEVGGALDRVVAPTAAALDRRRPALVQETDLRYWGFVTPGMVLGLGSRGVDARVRPTDLTSVQYGDRRTVLPGPGVQVVSVVGLDELAAGADPPGTEVARADRLTRRERDEADALHRAAATALDLPLDRPRPPLTVPAVRRRLLAGGMSAAEVRRLVELEDRGPSYAVFVDAGRRSP